MFNLLDLQQSRAHKILTLKDLKDRTEKADPPRPFTADECAIFDRETKIIGELDEQIAAAQAHTRRSEQLDKLILDLEKPNGRKTDPDPPANPQNARGVLGDFRIPATARRGCPLKAFKPRQGERQDDAERRAFRVGMWARSVIFRDQRASQWCLNNGMGVDIRGALGTNSNPDGGALVPEQFNDALIDLREQYGVARQQVQVYPMGRDTMLIPRRLGGISIGPIGENPAAGITQSNPQFNQVQLTAKKCGGLTLMSTEIAEDAVLDLAEWVVQEFAYGFALFEDQCLFTGDGTSTYLGIRGLTNLLTTASALAGAVAATSTHNKFSLVDNVDLTNTMSALPMFARRNAKWYCSSVAADLVFHRLQAIAGGNTVMTLQGGTGDSYLGYPIVISQVLPTSTGVINGTALLFFGDLSMAAAMGDRREVRVFPSEHRFMDTDQIGIRGTERIDIVVHDIGPTTVGTGTVGGPIVGLMGTS